MRQLPPGKTCQLIEDSTPIFTSESHWLHPLFELDRYLIESYPSRDSRGHLLLVDRIIGRAAALLITRLGIKKVETPIISSLALPVFDEFHIECTYQKTVDRLPCQTEEILASIIDPEEAWQILSERARRAKEAMR